MALPGWLYKALVVLAVCVAVWVIMFLGVVLAYYLRRKRRRATFVSGRQSLSDEEFLRGCGAPPERTRVCLGVRRAMAEVAWVLPESVYPGDKVLALAEMDLDGVDWLNVVFCLEKALGIKIPRGVVFKDVPPQKTADMLTVAEFSLRLAEVLEEEGLLGTAESSGEKGTGM